MSALPPLSRLLVVSPHLDDAVFGCGALLAAHPGSTVLTVFAGMPSAQVPLTDWDRRCGFARSADVMPARRAEDRAALALLGARPLWLDFLDAQYAQGNVVPEEALASALQRAIERHRPDAVVLPMGLFHADHARVHAAGLRLLRGAVQPLWLAVEDALYRRRPGLLQQRLVRLAREGVVATPAFPPLLADPAPKRRAVAAYASQLRAFGDGIPADLATPERYWRLQAGEEPEERDEG